jgi:iron complex transport system substrate-binding protein
MESAAILEDVLMLNRILSSLAALALLAGPAVAQNFPVTVEHHYGSTTIPSEPQRVVSVGLHEQDFLYALGVSPVGVREWFGDKVFATWSWADDEREALGAEPAIMDGDGINYEWVLAQDPDLIISTYWWLEEEDYARLSAIAPVVASPAGFDAWSAPWQEELRTIDLATSGTTAKADEIIAGFDARYAAVRAEYPELEGMTGTNIYYEEPNFTAWGPNDLASKFLVDLGLVFPPQLAELAEADNRITISPENMSLLEMDVAVWPIGDPANSEQSIIEAMPVYQSLDIAAEGRSVWLDDDNGLAYAAMSWQTPLSLGYLLDILPAQLAAAADGDPATRAE